MPHNGEFGELHPKTFIQEDERACLSACLLSETDSALGLTEEDVSQVLIDDGLYKKGVGTGLYPARELKNSIRKLGLSASSIYGARQEGEDEDTKIVERLAGIDRALRGGQKVIMAFPKKRGDEPAFLHYAVVKGFEESEEGDGVVILDPSDVDGGIERPSWEEMKNYVTPREGVPVMAWGIEKAGKEDIETEPIEEPGLPGFSLLGKPIWEGKDTGRPIPSGTDHPSSTSMPDADISFQFNNLGGIVLSRDGEYPAGYPRFVVPPQIRELSLESFGRTNMLPFPSRASADASAYMERTYVQAGMEGASGKGGSIVESNGLFWLSGTQFNEDSWQNAGLGISSRQATANLAGRPENDIVRRDAAEQRIKTVIEEYTGASAEDIYLFPTGMAGIYWLNQALIKAYGEAPGVQFGFPYTDTYDQRKFGPERNVSKNLLDFRDGDYERLRELSASDQQLRGLITEYPSNPLLATADLQQIDDIAAGEYPVVVDDTIGTMYNLDDGQLPPSVVARATSLTKFFSSVGDVMGGSVILRPDSPHYEAVKQALDEVYEDTLWHEDAEALADNSQLFPYVMERVNGNGEAVAGWINEEFTGDGKAIKNVYHPSIVDREAYDSLKKPGGGYSGLMSLRFTDPQRAYRFFDSLRVTKGPSLGTYYTLGCLYTLLAHKPLSSVEKFNVTPDLVRLSIGIEDEEELKGRIEQALEASR